MYHSHMLRSQLLKGTLPLMILSVLGDGELYGYEIAQRIRARSGAVLAPSEGSLYPALHRLERDGAVAGEWRASDRGPRRRYYRITPRGAAQLSASREEWESFASLVTAVAARAG
jgi:transcriptional regulator